MASAFFYSALRLVDTRISGTFHRMSSVLSPPYFLTSTLGCRLNVLLLDVCIRIQKYDRETQFFGSFFGSREMERPIHSSSDLETRKWSFIFFYKSKFLYVIAKKKLVRKCDQKLDSIKKLWGRSKRRYSSENGEVVLYDLWQTLSRAILATLQDRSPKQRWRRFNKNDCNTATSLT